MRDRLRMWCLLAVALLAPTTVFAQASIAGVVKDASGAVLPGVTVEAASPALIEKTRVAVSDGTGQYRVVDLRPGTYSVTFSLTGFSTVKRDAIEVSGDGVFTINVDMRVGSVAENITVTAETPVVDVQSVRRQSVLSSDVIAQLPASRGFSQLLNSVPSIAGGNLDSQVTAIGQGGSFFNTYGSRPNEGRLSIDGLSVGGGYNGGGIGFIPDPSMAAEMQVTVAGGLGETDIGSATVNFIPKTGGNTFQGTGFLSSSGSWSQTTNLDDTLRSYGITQAGLIKQWDFSGSLGGPIKKDRLWFFVNARSSGTYTTIPGVFGNANMGDASKWNYVKDPTVTARTAGSTTDYLGRVTAQVTPRNKVNVSYDQQFACAGSGYNPTDGCRPRGSDWIANGGAAASPESSTIYNDNLPSEVFQGTWSSTVTSKLLLEAGMSSYISQWGWLKPPSGLTNLIPVTETVANAFTGVPVPNFTYRGLDNLLKNRQGNIAWRGSAAYVTGAHNMKFGYQGQLSIDDQEDLSDDAQLTYTFTNGAPSGLTQRIAPWMVGNRTENYGLYAQDQWTRGRLTLQGALRYDRAWSWFPSDQNGAPVASRFNAAPIAFPTTQGVTGYSDLTPRMGAAYDVFGNGKTAVKVNLGKYLTSATNQSIFINANPAIDGRGIRAASGTSFVTNASRGWNDANHNLIPDCDLLNPLANGECGQDSNINFGNSNPVARLTVDPNVLSGWGIRPSDWHLGIQLQQQLMPRVSATFGYNRRTFHNFFVTDNLAVGPSDYDTYTLTAPLNPNLPGGGGYSFQALAIKPAASLRPPQNFFTLSSNYGNETRYYQAFDAAVDARPSSGLSVSLGTSTGRGFHDNCDIVAALPETLGANQRVSAANGGCHVAEPWLTSFRGSIIYTVPKVDVLLSGLVHFQTTTQLLIADNTPGTSGPSIAATALFPNTTVQQALGRLPAGALANGNTSINLLVPGTQYQPQIRTLDMRFAKVLKFGRTKTNVGIDVYNIFNSNTGTAYNQSFGFDGSTWLRPTAILNPRAVRFNITFNY